MKRHSFTLVKEVRTSASNIVANYLDLEHISVHPKLSNCHILHETSDTATFVLTTRIFGLPVTNVHHFCMKDANTFYQVVHTPFALMEITSHIVQTNPGPDWHSEIHVSTVLNLNRWQAPFANLMERVLRRSNENVFAEDLEILERRATLFGDYIEDYLRPDQPLILKDSFRKFWSRRTEKN